LNLVKFQEWGTAAGKSTIAKYVSHDPSMSKVKLAVPRGIGKDRVVKEYDVEVATLNKTCQARLKQIAGLQKKLDELLATTTPQRASGGPEGPGGAMPEERGQNRPGAQGPEGSYAGPGAPPAQPGAPTVGPPSQPAGPDPSESEPDPLGFAELPPVALATPAGPGAVPVFPGIAAGAASSEQPAGAVDRKHWRNSFAAFVANIKTGTDPSGKPQVDWGELRELGAMNELAAAQGPDAPRPSPEAETASAISERLGDVHWQLVVAKVEEAPGGTLSPQFRMEQLPKPLEMTATVDPAENPQRWATIAPGTPVRVVGRLIITEPYKITLKLRMDAP
jgi:hypothetical protein